VIARPVEIGNSLIKRVLFDYMEEWIRITGAGNHLPNPQPFPEGTGI